MLQAATIFRKSPPIQLILDNAAAVDADASPNMTRTTDGKQHMLARKADEEIHFHRVLLSSMG